MFRKQLTGRKGQSGSLYIVVIFVLVVMGFLATSLSRVQWSTSDAHTRDVLGTQAWLLAHSINEYVLTEFYPLATSAAISTICGDMGSLSARVNTILGTVDSCRDYDLTCTEIGELQEYTYYQVESRVNCGSGMSEVERVQEIWVREE